MAAPFPRRLDEAVAERAGVTRSRARSQIIAGRVRVDGRPATKPGAAVGASAVLDVERPRPFASRGGEKLDAALEGFARDVRGARALDVGASHGGFTDCLLQRGAAHVVAVDVGYGQLVPALRNDPRVTVLERTNFRTLEDGALGAPFDVVTIDTAFISVVTILARARAFVGPQASIVALIKPQFEAGRSRISDGVVRDPAVRAAILREVRAATLDLRLVPQLLVPSPLLGPAGNVEFFTLVRAGGVPYDDAAIAAAIAASPV